MDAPFSSVANAKRSCAGAADEARTATASQAAAFALIAVSPPGR